MAGHAESASVSGASYEWTFLLLESVDWLEMTVDGWAFLCLSSEVLLAAWAKADLQTEVPDSSTCGYDAQSGPENLSLEINEKDSKLSLRMY